MLFQVCYAGLSCLPRLFPLTSESGGRFSVSDVQLYSESMESIDFGILDSEGLEALAKANNVPWAGLSRVQLVGALRKKILLSDDNGENLMKTASS